MSNSQQTQQRCVFCGCRRRTTRDHIPPRCLFPKGSRANLITVPACQACNLGTSGDDEYLRLILVANAETNDHPDAEKLRSAVLRSFAKPTKEGFMRAFADSCRQVKVMTPGGLFLQYTTGFQQDAARIDRIFGKIVRGLFYHEYRRRLPGSHRVLCLTVTGLKRKVPRGELESWRNQVRMLLHGGIERWLGNVLVYRCNRAPRAAFRSVWGLTFYGSIHFFAFTGSEKYLRQFRI